MGEQISSHELREGDVVYLLDRVKGNQAKLEIRKGTIDFPSTDPRLTIAIWEKPDSGPGINQAYQFPCEVFSLKKSSI